MDHSQQTNPLVSKDLLVKNGVTQTITTFLNSICGLPQYQNKSYEELRWEDYLNNNKFPKKPPPVASAPAIAGAACTNNSSRADSPTNGTRDTKYKPTEGADIKPSIFSDAPFTHTDTNIKSITAMLEYERFSLEELRYYDYKNGLKYPKRPPTSSNSLINPTGVNSLNNRANNSEISSFNANTRAPTTLTRPPTIANTSRSLTAILSLSNPAFTSGTMPSNPNPRASTAANVKIEPNKVSVKVEEKQTEKPDADSGSSDPLDKACCPICLETLVNLKKANIRLRSTICGHIMCQPCADSLIKNAKRTMFDCPNCRKLLFRDQVHDLYI